MQIFIEQTAKDYNMEIETVSSMYKSYWPNKFYGKLEEIVELGKKADNKQIQVTRKDLRLI